MGITIGSWSPVPDQLSVEAVRLIAALLALAAALPAQPTPASITTINQPTSGAAVFDGSGNVYYLNGPVTPGAAQTQGGGLCTAEVFPIGPQLLPCSNDQIVKVDPAGNVVYGTYVGGPTATYVTGIVVDAAGNVFVTGPTGGSLPTTSGAAIPASTTAKAFAARLSADGSSFLYSTYLPDSAATATAIAIDSQDNAYITGKSATGAPYAIKLSPDGSSILYNISLTSTGSNTGSGTGLAIAIDPTDNAIVAGSTSAPGFPSPPGRSSRAWLERRTLSSPNSIPPATSFSPPIWEAAVPIPPRPSKPTPAEISMSPEPPALSISLQLQGPFSPRPSFLSGVTRLRPASPLRLTPLAILWRGPPT